MATGGTDARPSGDLTDEDLQDLHECILDKDEEGVREVIRECTDDGLPIVKLCSTEVELEPAAHDHPLNRLPLSGLHRSALLDSSGILAQLLTSAPGLDVDLRLTSTGYTPLHLSASVGVLASVNYLTSAGAGVDAADADGCTPLHLAAAAGHKDVMSLLCVRGASVHVTNSAGRSPLHLAAEHGHAETADFLLGRSADVNLTDGAGRTALHAAQVRGHVGVTARLLERGADPDVTDSRGDTAVIVWATSLHDKLKGHGCSSNSSLSSLLRHRANVKIANKVGDTALHIATTQDAVWLVELLLNQGATANAANDLGRTPLFGVKSAAVYQILIDQGADISWTDKHADTPLHVYAKTDDVTTAALTALVDAGADVNAQNEAKESPLLCACAAGSPDKVRVLLGAGAANDCMDDRGRGVLHATIRHGHSELTSWLLERNNVSVWSQDCDGDSPLHLAVTTGDERVVRRLVTASRQHINVRNKLGHTAAMLAADDPDKVGILTVLLENGAVLEPAVAARVLLTYVTTGDVDVVTCLLRQTECNLSVDQEGKSALHLALGAGKAGIAGLLLDNGADIECTDCSGRTPIHDVCRAPTPDTEPLVARLISRDNCSKRDSTGATALHYGIGDCDVSTVRLFLDAGYDVNTAELETGRTVSHVLLSSYRDPETVFEKLEMLVTSPEFEPSAKDNAGTSLLHCAAAARVPDPPLVELLIETGGDVNATNNNNQTPLHCACAADNPAPNVIRVLVKHGADVNAADSEGLTPFFHAVLKKSTQVVDVLLTRPVDTAVRDSRGRTCLMVAMETGLTDVCCELLLSDSPVDVGVTDETGSGLLHYAARFGTTDLVGILLDIGCDLDATDQRLSTPVHSAAQNPDPAVLRLLLSQGVDVNRQDQAGDSPLHLACRRGSYDHVKHLLDHNADTSLQNNSRQTATHLAALATDPDVLQLLIASEVDVDVRDADGRTPLMVSIADGHGDTATVLLDQSPDLGLRDSHGNSVLHLVAEKFDRQRAEYLLRRHRHLLTTRNHEGSSVLDCLRRRGDSDLQHLAEELSSEDV